MNKIYFSDELMARFYDGETTPEETIMILRAAKENPELKEEIDFMMSIPRELMDIQINREELKEKTKEEPKARVVSISDTSVAAASMTTPSTCYPLQLYRLAAKTRESGHDMKAPNDCVVRCEHYILQQFGKRASIEKLSSLSKDKGWLKEGGTPLHQIGRLLSEFYRLSVVRRYDCTKDDIKQELKSDCKVIAVINADKLYGKQVERDVPNHAIVVLSIDNEHVSLFDPQQGEEISCSTDNFIFAWKDSHYYIISVTKRGSRKYNPDPIDTSSFKIDDDLEELIEAIAENAHEIWAKERMADHWRYGDKRDDTKKEHPDLVPYSDLTDEEKKYDRKMARGTIELLKRLGYEIKKKE